jgi:cation diffusion facilitator CzcD-associated flavoprotein CzcO
MGEVIDENDLARHIRYHHRSVPPPGRAPTTCGPSRHQHRDGRDAAASPATSCGCARATTATSEGYTPEWPGMDGSRAGSCTRRPGPTTSTTRGRRSSCIGSGATTATVVPAIAGQCEHVTVLQRSPTYFWTGRNANETGRHAARAGDRRDLDPRDRAPQDPARPADGHPALRSTSRRWSRPSCSTSCGPAARGLRRRQALHAQVPAVAAAPRVRARRRPVRRHQRRQGQHGDRRDRHVHRDGHPLQVRRGAEADIIITATGFNLSVLGDIEFTLDGTPVDWPTPSPIAG